jgi:hypothetical protein
LGVPPQEKCGVGLSATIFFVFCICFSPKAKNKKGFSLQSLTLLTAQKKNANKPYQYNSYNFSKFIKQIKITFAKWKKL